LLISALGHLARTFCFIPYYPGKFIHQKHHSWAGNLDHDPVLKSLRKFRDGGVPGAVRFAWRSWLPLGALMQHFVYLSYPLTMWKEGERDKQKLARSLVSLAWMPTSYVLLWLFVPALSVATVLPAFVLFLFAEELVNLPHHVGMPTTSGRLRLWEQHRVTRSCYYPRGLSELLVLNFNFHIEHHLFPSLPWYRLRGAREQLRPVLAEHYNECVGIEWNLKERKQSLEAIVSSYRGKGAEA
jgi:fatty acid desaturase